MLNKKIKVLFAINDLGRGGAQRLVVDFATRLNPERFESWLLYIFPEESLLPDLEPISERVVYIPLKNSLDLTGWLKLFAFLRRERFQIVYTHLSPTDIIVRFLAWCAKTPVILTHIHNFIPSERRGWLIPFLERKLARITDGVTSGGPLFARYAQEKWGFKDSQLPLVEVGIDLTPFTQIPPRTKERMRKELGIPADAIVLISVGRLWNQKGHTYLLKATKLLLPQFPNLRVIIAGDGPLWDGLHQEQNELGLNNYVNFLGDRKDIPHLLAASDIFVFPSIWEGQGLAPMEAMAMGLPVIATDVGGVTELVTPDERGLIVPPADTEALCGAIAKLILDTNLRKKLGETGRKYVFEKRNINHTIEALTSAFDYFLQQKLAK